MPRPGLAVLFLLALSVHARQAVGLIVSADAAELKPAGSANALHAQPGDLLFPGDTLTTAEKGRVTFAFCPTKVRYAVADGATVDFGAQKLQGAAKQLRPEPVCALPDASSGSDLRIQAAAETLALGQAARLKPIDLPLDAARSAELAQQVADLDEAIQADPSNLLLAVSKAAILTQNGQIASAQAVYRAIQAGGASPAWAGAQVVDMASRGIDTSKATSSSTSPGATYALLIGVSQYQNLDKSVWLHYADADATLFHDYLRSPRGGQVPEANIHTLTNEKATRDSIKAELAAVMNQAGPNDTVLVFMAAHGIVLTGSPQGGAYILTHDSSFEKPEDALPMSLIQDLVEKPAARAKQVLVFIDVCHAGTIGLLPPTARALNQRTSETLDRLATQPSIFGLMASESSQDSLESDRFGSGHGAFTWYLIEGLNGAAPNDGKAISRESLLDYVYNAVCEATNNRQTPALRGNPQLGVAIVPDITAEGLQLPTVGAIPSPRRCAAKPLEARKTAPSSSTPAPIAAAARDLPRAITPERIAFEQSLARPAVARPALDALAPQLTPEQLALDRNRLRVAFEASGERVIQNYISGEESAPPPSGFTACAADFDQALALAPDNPPLAARADFCRGRALIFDKNYPAAIARLERAIREDPLQSYSFNALGIAYLEQAQFDRAIPALRDAIRLSPFWAYPRHNLALALREQGKLAESLREYGDARLRAPSRSYLPYNQGLIYYQINQLADAEHAYNDAIAKSNSTTAKPFIARGVLYAHQRKWTLAEADYRHALSLAQIPEDRLAARYNLAVLLKRTPAGSADAIALWRANLADKPDDLPTLEALGDALATNPADAIPVYESLVRLAPGNAAARVKLGRLLLAANRAPDAIAVLREAPPDTVTADLYLSLGDAQAAAGHPAEARAAYAAGAAIAPTRTQRNRLKSLSLKTPGNLSK